MPKTEIYDEIDQLWNPPSDRVLLMKAKVKTGWSSRSSIQQTTKQQQQQQQKTQISESELLEIENVMKRAALLEKKELSRINKLYDRFNYINKPKGNGDTQCVVCGSNFSSFTSSPRICSMCLKNCCGLCCIDSNNNINNNNNNNMKYAKWFCKICSEYYEFLKKSGAWFHNRLPIENKNIDESIDIDDTERYNSVSSSNSYINEESTRKASNISIHNEIIDNEPSCDDQIKTYLSPDYIGKPYSSSSVNYSNNSNNSNKIIFQKNFDNSSISGSDTFSINENKLQFTEINLNIDTVSKCSRSNSIRDMSKQSSIEEEEKKEKIIIKKENFDNNNHKEDSIDLEFKKYSSINKLTIGYNNDFEIYDDYDDEDDDDNNNIMTSTKNDDNQNVPSLSKRKFHSFKSKLSSASASSKPSPISTSKSDGKIIDKTNCNDKVINNDESLGTLKFSVLYNSSLQQLTIHIFNASDLPARDSNGLSDPYVKIHLLPSLAKSTKLRSKTVYKTLNPEFHETLTYGGISLKDLDTKTLRLTVLDEDKIGFDYIGEYRLTLKNIQIDEINDYNIKLENIKEIGDDLDTHFRGKINFALKYSKLTQTLFVKIIRCTQLLPMDNGRSSDPFIEIALIPLEKTNKHKQRTSTKWKTLDPEYMEEFKFLNVDLKTLLSKTIQISVWDKDLTSNDFIGSVKLSEKETGDELTHFYTMIKNPDIYHEQWHTLKVDNQQ